MKQYRTLILIFIIVVISIFLVWPNNPGIHFAGINHDIKTALGLDLVGGVQVLLEADVPEGTEITAQDMTGAINVVENRVNALGVSEAVVQKAGDRRIVVELPGVEDPDKAVQTIGTTALLEFVDFSSVSQAEVPQYVGQKIATDYLAGGEGTSPLPTPTTSQVTGTITSTTVISPELKTWNTIMIGDDIENVAVQVGNVGEYMVAFQLTPEGTKKFADFTSANVGKPLAIVLDKTVISAPVINEAITQGQGVITGNFTSDEANRLAIQLRSGSLPVPLREVLTRKIGPTLGQDSLQKSLVAGLIGATLVIMFMLLYYRLPGAVADIAVIIYALITFGLYRFIPVTLTLPGIAGFLLSTGSALDANILMFERTREELRNGRSLRQAIDQGWQRAWPSIRDSNVATLITCAILWFFGSISGTTIIKGFSLTLAIGVTVSVFTAIVITRTLLSLVVTYLKPTDYRKWFGI